MKFQLIDQVLESTPEKVVAIKNVTSAEEYLADHFPSFPVLPGVFMLEAMIQAARTLLEQQGHPRMMLGEVRALRYGSFVRPGESLKVEVNLQKQSEGAFVFKGQGLRLRQDDRRVRPARLLRVQALRPDRVRV